MSIAHVTDHYEQAVARLPMVYRNKPRFLAWLAAYCARVQNIEDALWDVYVDRLIQNGPTGDLLAKLGAIVGQTDLLGDDVSFLLFIQARILVNRSKGRRRDLVRVTQAMWPVTAAPVVWAFDMAPATLLLIPQAPVEVNPYVMFNSFLNVAVGAGVRLIFIWTLEPMADTLLLADAAGGFTPGANQLLSDSAGAYDGGVLSGTV